MMLLNHQVKLAKCLKLFSAVAVVLIEKVAGHNKEKKNIILIAFSCQ